ncbi:MAG: glycerol-3-phosphate acyltransferase, partial [Eubacterium sp.]|nr:glycerol-3-phosphate acyltransferase [Eubacterium sp.]
GKGVTVTCTWLIIAMPVWGTISCLAGGALTILSGYLPLGAIVIAWLGSLCAFLTESTKAGVFFLIGALIMTAKHFPGILGMIRETEPRHFRHPKKN